MCIRLRLLLLREIERRNEERIKDYENQRKGPSQPCKRKTNRNMGKLKK